jgi:chaperonin cofactor prefoldin
MLVEKDIARLQSEKSNLDKEMEASNKKIKKLKSTLYGKFGNSINLEE